MVLLFLKFFLKYVSVQYNEKSLLGIFLRWISGQGYITSFFKTVYSNNHGN